MRQTSLVQHRMEACRRSVPLPERPRTIMRRRTSTPRTPPGGVTRSRDRIFRALRHDPYQAKAKYREPTACASCGAIFERGRWKWGETPAGAHEATCPASALIATNCPPDSWPCPDNSSTRIAPSSCNSPAMRPRANAPSTRCIGSWTSPRRGMGSNLDLRHTLRAPHRRGSQGAYDGGLDLRFGEDEYSVRVAWTR